MEALIRAGVVIAIALACVVACAQPVVVEQQAAGVAAEQIASAIEEVVPAGEVPDDAELARDALNLARSHLGPYYGWSEWTVWPADVATDVPETAFVFAFFGDLHHRTNNVLTVRWDAGHIIAATLRNRLHVDAIRNDDGPARVPRLAVSHDLPRTAFLRVWRATLLLSGARYDPPPATGGGGGGTTHSTGDFVRVWRDRESLPRFASGFMGTGNHFDDLRAAGILRLWYRLLDGASVRAISADASDVWQATLMTGEAMSPWAGATVEALRRELDPGVRQVLVGGDDGFEHFVQLAGEYGGEDAEASIREAESMAARGERRLDDDSHKIGDERARRLRRLAAMGHRWSRDEIVGYLDDVLDGRVSPWSGYDILRAMTAVDAESVRRTLLRRIDSARTDDPRAGDPVPWLRSSDAWTPSDRRRFLAHPNPAVRVATARAAVVECAAGEEEWIALDRVASDPTLPCALDENEDQPRGDAIRTLLNRWSGGSYLLNAPERWAWSNERVLEQIVAPGESPASIEWLADRLGSGGADEVRPVSWLLSFLDRPIDRRTAAAALALKVNGGDGRLDDRLASLLAEAERLGWPDGSEPVFRALRDRLSGRR